MRILNDGRRNVDVIIGICEDQEEIRKDLRERINAQEDDVSFQIYEFDSGEAILESKIAFDLLFMDIELKGSLSGLKAAEVLQHRLPDLILVFVSGYTQYVSSAFHLNTFQFLLKPLDDKVFHEEFLRCVNHYRAENDVFRVSQNGEIIEIRLKDIIFIESDKRKLVVHLRNGKIYETYGKISEQQKILAVHHFIRIHKSYLVNCKYIHKMNEEVVWMQGEKKGETFSLPLSRRCKVSAKEQYHAYFFEA